MNWKSILLLAIVISASITPCAATTEGTDESAACWFINALCYGGISDGLNTLISDLYADTTNEREYIPNVYDCTNYAINLTANLSDGYESGIVVRLSKGGDVPGHMMTWVRVDELLYVIEPQSDIIYGSDMFNASVDDDRFVLTYGTKELGWTEYNTTTSIGTFMGVSGINPYYNLVKDLQY